MDRAVEELFEPSVVRMMRRAEFLKYAALALGGLAQVAALLMIIGVIPVHHVPTVEYVGLITAMAAAFASASLAIGAAVRARRNYTEIPLGTFIKQAPMSRPAAFRAWRDGIVKAEELHRGQSQ